MTRKIIIACNWKMNKTSSQSIALINEIKEKLPASENKFIVCPPFTSLEKLCDNLKGSKIEVGAQNCHWEEKGAFTGEIAPDMLSEIGVKYVIIGHSERRTYFGETDETVNKRIKAALSHGLTPILCVGESLEIREQGNTKNLIKSQIIADLKEISKADSEKIIIAYEPIWAIGTGKTATSDQAEEICKFIRDTLAEIYGNDSAEKTHVLYGGSMNEKNAEELLSRPNIDGGLIGGASLKPDAITEILNISNHITK